MGECDGALQGVQQVEDLLDIPLLRAPQMQTIVCAVSV